MFTHSSAQAKVKAAQRLWNTRTPSKIVKAYTDDSVWRNRDSFLRGHAEIEAFLEAKWRKETEYRLRKELFLFGHDRIAVQFWYEYKSAVDSQWYRCYGLEDWTFDATGKMKRRMMSGNDVPIRQSERWFASAQTDDEIDRLLIPEIEPNMLCN
ncbi:uncharacterized protein L969DRAFT_51858 [Mixia osmundae IAM 14324]|uniref:DUF1348-domain-containing protein n=1 Tax=Mixia osmundae (strain CBS 9802 / IAM 14324 / JCM 22182 / KY 12970) TaxID=764103 RepID=G7DX40_MIXOS|nr:uncharacterized protein L969DRAFT_51858 [Mixia osmundae IAM 14324]KEI38055.1 hypothetical protein L969DRAFT_51858 [Mixia osmundae IAM 14324]GAA95137.1 hypothetical protein E5Q_01792 [Mixia osmundae IAM 14324]